MLINHNVGLLILPFLFRLDMSLVDLLCGEEEVEQTTKTDFMIDGQHIIEICREINQGNDSKNIKRNVSVVQDAEGNNIVVINDIIFKGKRSVDWKDVRAYLKEYVGEFYTIVSAGDVIYIGSDLPNEYSGSKYTHCIKGANAKAN